MLLVPEFLDFSAFIRGTRKISTATGGGKLVSVSCQTLFQLDIYCD